MASNDIYVEITAAGSNQPAPELTLIFLVSGPKIDGFRNQNEHYRNASDQVIAEDLAADRTPDVIVRQFPIASPTSIPVVGVVIKNRIALPRRPSSIESRDPDYAVDGLKAWILKS